MGSSKTTQTTKARPWTTDQLKGLYSEINSLATNINRTPFEANPFARAAELTPDELAAEAYIRDNTGRYQGTLDQGLQAQLRAMEMGGRAPTEAELQGYMNPFTEQVLNRTIERIREQGDVNNREISSRSALSGAFGGSRQGLLEGLNFSNTQRNVGDTFYQGMSDNYNQALSTYLGQIDRLSNMAGRTMEGAAYGQQGVIKDAAALEASGLKRRQRDQVDLDLRGQDFLRGQNKELSDLNALAAAIGAISPGSIGQDSKTTTTQSQSPLQTALGIASLVAAPFTGGASMLGSSVLGGGLGGLVGGGWNGISNYIQGFAGKKAGGAIKKKSFAYGGRVGNPFSQGESSDVIRQTQNPFANLGRGTTPGGYNNTVNPSTLLGGNAGPTAVNTAPGFVSPEAPPMYNAGPVSMEMMSPPDRGGNPVARLLDQYKMGARIGAPIASDMMGRVNLNDQSSTMGFAGGGGIVQALAGALGGGANPPQARKRLPFEGVPNPNEGDFFDRIVPRSGGPRMVDKLFGKDNISDTLLQLGIGILGAPSIQEGIANTLGALTQSKEVDPYEQALQMLKLENLQSQIEDREGDSELAREKFNFEIANALSDDAALAAHRAAGLSLEEQRIAAAAARDGENKPNYQGSDFADIEDTSERLNVLVNGSADGKTPPNYAAAGPVAAKLRKYAAFLLKKGYEAQAELFTMQANDAESIIEDAKAKAGLVPGNNPYEIPAPGLPGVRSFGEESSNPNPYNYYPGR